MKKMKTLLAGLAILISISSMADSSCKLSTFDIDEGLKEVDMELSWTAKHTLNKKFNLTQEDIYPRLEISNYCQQKEVCWTIANIVDVDMDGNRFIRETADATGVQFIESAIENGIESVVKKLNGCL